MNPKAIAAQFDELVQAYYRAWFRFHPESAVSVGVPGYSHLLTPCSEEAKGALICLNDELRVSLEELNPKRLDVDRQLDYELLRGAVELENRYVGDLETFRPDPQRWLPVNAIYQLTIRDVEDLDHALRSRLEQIPEHLQEAEAVLGARASAIPPLWAQSTAIAARRGADFVNDIVRHPRIAKLTAPAAISPIATGAAQALRRFADFLERVVPRARGNFACGPDYFEHLLRQRHFLEVGADRLHAFGEHLFEQTREKLEAVCAKRYGHRDFLGILRERQAPPLPANHLLRAYSARMRAARAFVVSRKLITMPRRERLDVVETPVFARHEIPFAAYVEPAPDDADQVGYYYVTLPADAAHSTEHEQTGIAHTSAHEAYPGHHLQFVTANRNSSASSLPRLFNRSSTFYEGWALYAEQLMFEQGFFKDAESEVLLLRDRLWRALRIMLDVELHTRGLSADMAADRMVAALGFARDQALADVNWYTRSPTVPLGYATGWALINALRDRKVEGKSVRELRSFHDDLLSVGSIAAPLVIRRAFGTRTWRSITNGVFGGVGSG